MTGRGRFGFKGRSNKYIYCLEAMGIEPVPRDTESRLTINSAVFTVVIHRSRPGLVQT